MNQAGATATDVIPPYVGIEGIEEPVLSSIPDLSLFQQLADGESVKRGYDIRVRKPKFPWLLFWVTLITVVMPLALWIWYSVWPKRGHTFLYITDRRIVIVELEQGFTGRGQTVLNYNNEDVAGFQVYTQHGVWRLLDMIKLRERRTFYISLLTGSSAVFTLGALNARRSNYDPGPDAVTLCAELDSTLLAIKAGTELPGERR